MEISNKMRSKVLIDALPYIQKYNNKVVVVKYGGNAMTNDILKDAVMNDIVLLSAVGIKAVLVRQTQYRKQVCRRPQIYRQGNYGGRSDGARRKAQ